MMGTLNVGKIEEGFVLDHIPAGKSMAIYHDLGLNDFDCTVAIIKNARSNLMGKKDIIKVECPIDEVNLDISDLSTAPSPSMSLKTAKLWKSARCACPKKSAISSAAKIPAVLHP